MNKYQSIALCIALPALALTIHMLNDPHSGVGMIMGGIFTLGISAVVGAFHLAKALLPWIAAPLVGYAVFKLKSADRETLSIGDCVCGVAAAISVMAIHQYTFGIFALLMIYWASVVIADTRGWIKSAPRSFLITVLFVLMVVSLVMECMVFVASVDMKKDKLQAEWRRDAYLREMEHEKTLSAMYTVADPVAFAQADAQIVDMINSGQEHERKEFRTWMMTDAVVSPAHVDERGVEIIPFDEDNELACFEGRHIKGRDWTVISAAVARRACMKRAGLVN